MDCVECKFSEKTLSNTNKHSSPTSTSYSLVDSIPIVVCTSRDCSLSLSHCAYCLLSFILSFAWLAQKLSPAIKNSFKNSTQQPFTYINTPLSLAIVVQAELLDPSPTVTSTSMGSAISTHEAEPQEESSSLEGDKGVVHASAAAAAAAADSPMACMLDDDIAQAAWYQNLEYTSSTNKMLLDVGSSMPQPKQPTASSLTLAAEEYYDSEEDKKPAAAVVTAPQQLELLSPAEVGGKMVLEASSSGEQKRKRKLAAKTILSATKRLQLPSTTPSQEEDTRRVTTLAVKEKKPVELGLKDQPTFFVAARGIGTGLVARSAQGGGTGTGLVGNMGGGGGKGIVQQ
jgi:hypothetical protein